MSCQVGCFNVSKRNCGVVAGAIYGHGATTVLEWDGPVNGTMMWSHGVTMSRYIGLNFDCKNIASTALQHLSETLSVTHAHSTFICVCVCICVLRDWFYAAIVEVPDPPSLKWQSHWSLALYPAVMSLNSIVVHHICPIKRAARFALPCVIHGACSPTRNSLDYGVTFPFDAVD